MFLRFNPLSAIRDFPRPACRVRRPRPGHLTFDRIRRQFRLEGLEDRCLLSGISSITEFPLPSGSVTNTGGVLEAITSGPDGNLWFAEQGAGAIGMINPTTHAISSFPVPSGAPFGVTAGPDGNIWFTDPSANEIGTINPTTHAISMLTLPAGSKNPRQITTGPDGNLWFTLMSSHQIGEINPTTHAISETNISPVGGVIMAPAGITAGPDGNLWFTDASGLIGEINPTSHAYTLFNPSALPLGITAGPDGNLWFTTQDSFAGIGTINPTSDAITLFASPTGSSPVDITAGLDGNLWFTDQGGYIGVINPTSDAITACSIPYAGSSPEGITTGPDGNLWFLDEGASAIGVATLTTSQLVVTTQPPASVTAGSPFGLTVDAENSSGDLLSSFNGTVTVALASNPGGGTLGGILTATASDGVATFSNLSLTTAAAGYTLMLSGSGLGSGVTSAFTVSPGSASQVVITQQPPASVTAGSGFGLTATIEDMYGNVESGDNSDVVSVALASNPGGTTLGGTVSVTVSQGVATFSALTLTKAAAGYKLGVSSTSPGSATTNALTVTPAVATQLVITTEPPASVVVNADFGLIAAIEDAYGNVETSSSGTVKVALDNNPGGAKLGGTLSVKASKGVAAFSGLTLNKVGSGYTLELTSSGLTTAITSAITVTNADIILTPSAMSGAAAPDPSLAPLVLDSAGFLDSLGLKKHVRTT